MHVVRLLLLFVEIKVRLLIELCIVTGELIVMMDLMNLLHVVSTPSHSIKYQPNNFIKMI